MKGKVAVAAMVFLLGIFSFSMVPAAYAVPVSQTLYGCDGNVGGVSTLYTIDPSTGVVTVVGSMVNDYGCSGMDYAGGTLYASGDTSTGVVALFTVNTATGVATEVGPSNQGSCSSAGQLISDISFGPSGALFALFVTPGAGGAGNPCLGTLNPYTGAETDVGNTGMVQAGDGLAASSSNVLYGADLASLYTIDQSTGAATVLAPLSGGVTGNGICTDGGSPFSASGVAQAIDAMKFNAGGTLYAIINCGRGFVAGNTFLATLSLSGALTVIGETANAAGTPVGIDGIAWVPQSFAVPGVPQFPLGPLGMLTLLGLMLPVLMLLRSRFLGTARTK